MIRKFLNCQGSDRVELGPVEAVEHIGVVLQRVPVRRKREELAQVGLADLQNVIVGQVVGHADPPARVLEHPHTGGDDGDGHLHRGGILMRHQPPGLVDVEIRAAPPRLIRVSHDERAQDVGSADDLVGHDPDAGLQVVVAAAQLVQRRDGGVARTIRIVNRRTVDRLAVLPDGEFIGDGERLAVADDHPDDMVVGRHPAHDEGVHAHARQANLAPRAVGVLEGERGQFLFVRAPAHFRRRRPFLAEALDAPGVDELVDLLGPIGNLRVALAAVDHLDAELWARWLNSWAAHVRDLFGLGAAELPVRQRPLGDIEEGLLGEVADQPGWRRARHRGRPRLLHAAIIRRSFM